MKCQKCGCEAIVGDYDHDVRAIEVYNSNYTLLGRIIPSCLADSERNIAEIDSGCCPVCEGWEDGLGNTCTEQGWGNVILDGNAVDFDAAVMLMDDEIRERLHNELAPCANQEFLDAYAAAHEEKFGEEFMVG